VRRAVAALFWLVAVLAAVPGLAEAPAGTSLYNLESKWTRSDGTTATLKEMFGGQNSVLAMIYTGCSSICPLIVERMKAIEEALPEAQRPRVRFVLVSLDSTFDTPERLQAFAVRHGVDAARWGLYRGDERAVRQLAMALGVGYRPDGQGGFDHSSLLSLIDAGGSIDYQHSGTDAAIDAFVSRLVPQAR
jgi:protein SCO1